MALAQYVMLVVRIFGLEVLYQRRCVSVRSCQAVIWWKGRILGEVHIKEVEVETSLYDSCKD